jgi:hypothetical protein
VVKVSLPALNFREESTENRAFFVAFGHLGGKMGAKIKRHGCNRTFSALEYKKIPAVIITAFILPRKAENEKTHAEA